MQTINYFVLLIANPTSSDIGVGLAHLKEFMSEFCIDCRLKETKYHRS